MPLCKKITSLSEPLDIDLQLMASELDTSVKNMKYLSKTIMDDALLIDAFDRLCKDIESGDGAEITTFNDNTILYEYLDEAVVVYNILGIKYIIFDSLVTQKIESKLTSYR